MVISNLVYSVNKLNKIFFIIFGLFFGLIVLFYGINFSQKNSIIISGSEINSLINIWQDQTGRVPSQDEINIIINNLIEEEVLYQEALKLGLDKNDKIILGKDKINILDLFGSIDQYDSLMTYIN